MAHLSTILFNSSIPGAYSQIQISSTDCERDGEMGQTNEFTKENPYSCGAKTDSAIVSLNVRLRMIIYNTIVAFTTLILVCHSAFSRTVALRILVMRY